MPFVVVAPSGRLAGTHRQHGLAAVERLNLGLFVHTQNDGALGRRDVEANDVAHFGHEIRIGGKLEGLHPVRLQPEGAPDALHGRDRQAAGLGHAARTPMGGVLRATLERLDDHRFDAGIVNGARGPRARLVVEPVQALLHKAPPPLADRRPVKAELSPPLACFDSLPRRSARCALSRPAPAPSSAASPTISVRNAHHRLM